MKFFRRFLLVPASVAVLLLEFFFFAGLVLWLVGWPYAHRLQTSNDYDGLWDDNGPALFYYITLTVLVLANMILLPLTLIPIWKGYISRWSIAATVPLTLWILALLTNILYAMIRFIPLGCAGLPNDHSNLNYEDFDVDSTEYCRGSKIVWAGTVVLMFTAAFCAGYLIWLLQETLFQGIRKVHKRAKGRDAKLETVRRT